MVLLASLFCVPFMVKIENLKKTYRTGLLSRQIIPVLNGVDFEAKPGEITSVIGRNGSGKTTLFKIIFGSEGFDSGRLCALGHDYSLGTRDLSGRIAYIPTEFRVPTMFEYAKDLIFSFGLMQGLSLTEIHKRFEKADQFFELESFINRHSNRLSTGQKARIGLTCSMMFRSPEIFIYDEPNNGLDYEIIANVHEWLRYLAKTGNTVILSSHILTDISSLSNKIYHLNNGVMVDGIERLESNIKVNHENIFIDWGRDK